MAPRTGRPVKGKQRVHDLERVTIRLTPEGKSRLTGLAEWRDRTMYETVERALQRAHNFVPPPEVQRMNEQQRLSIENELSTIERDFLARLELVEQRHQIHVTDLGFDELDFGKIHRMVKVAWRPAYPWVPVAERLPEIGLEVEFKTTVGHVHRGHLLGTTGSPPTGWILRTDDLSPGDDAQEATLPLSSVTDWRLYVTP